MFQEEYLAKFLSGGVGQYFDEWDPAMHLCKPFDPPKDWRRFGMLDYGYVNPLCFLMIAISPDGQGFVYREVYRSRMLDSDQAALVAEACVGDRRSTWSPGLTSGTRVARGRRGNSPPKPTMRCGGSAASKPI